MKIKVVIFDLDGTITKPYLDFQIIRNEMGLVDDSLHILEAIELMGEDDRSKAVDILHRYEAEAVENSTLNEGAVQTLQELRKRGLKIAILTRNLENNARKVAKRHGLDFDMIVDRDAGPAKPDAFGVMYVCESFGISPDETLLVGDYVHDIQTAKAAGTTGVLIKTHPNAETFAQDADFSISKLSEIFQVLDELEGW